jgi:catalase
VLLRVNAGGKFVYVKYHFLVDTGQKQFNAEEALKYGGEDPDYSKRDLWSAIEKGEQISYTAHVQIMQPDEADPAKLGFDPFDVTKVWPKKQFPVCSTQSQSKHLAFYRLLSSTM